MYRWFRLVASSCNFLSSPYGRKFLKIYTQRESMYELFMKAEINK